MSVAEDRCDACQGLVWLVPSITHAWTQCTVEVDPNETPSGRVLLLGSPETAAVAVVRGPADTFRREYSHKPKHSLHADVCPERVR